MKRRATSAVAVSLAAVLSSAILTACGGGADRATAYFENGKEFRIRAEGFSPENAYVVSAALNGQPFDRAWIEHSDIAAGGELVLRMGPKPSDWGSGVLPPSKERD